MQPIQRRGGNISASALASGQVREIHLAQADLSQVEDVVDGGRDTRGWRVLGWLRDGQLMIKAGCHNFTLAEARAHWGAESYLEDHRVETQSEMLAAVEKIVAAARARGWQFEEGAEPVISAQAMYDLRELTGFVSGNDLHDLFEEILDGEPSPSGRATIGQWTLALHPAGRKALWLLDKPQWDVLKDIQAYTRAMGDVTPSPQRLSDALPGLILALYDCVNRA